MIDIFQYNFFACMGSKFLFIPVHVCKKNNLYVIPLNLKFSKEKIKKTIPYCMPLFVMICLAAF